MTTDERCEDVTQETRTKRRTLPSSSVVRLSGRLVEISGAHPGRIHHVGEAAIVGRNAGPGMIAIDAADVSRQHLRIARTAEGFLLEDLDSRNGTSVNGVPVRRCHLQNGDEIQLGAEVFFVFSLQGEVEQQLHQARRMEAVGSLAGGVAHDFNNLLTVISGNTDYLRTTIEHGDFDPASSLRLLAEMDRACDRASQLVQQLQRFASPSTPDSAGRIDLHDVLHDAVALCRRTVRANIEISVESKPGLFVDGDAVQLQQVLLDICVNARDAMPEGGRLKLAAARLSGAPARPLMPAGPFIELRIEDTGCGMDESTRERIFEPFFTTRRDAGGTGLGLTRVYAVLREHGGQISVQSDVGQGTTVVLRIPALVEAALGAPPETRPVPRLFEDFDLSPRLRRVLLVDDDVQVRRAVGRLLEHMGCIVTHAGDGMEALELVAEQAEPFQLVVLDVQMPRLDGRAVLRTLREQGHRMPVLVTSGGLDEAEVATLPSLGAQGFLPKPARLSDIQAALTRIAAQLEGEAS